MPRWAGRAPVLGTAAGSGGDNGAGSGGEAGSDSAAGSSLPRVVAAHADTNSANRDTR